MYFLNGENIVTCTYNEHHVITRDHNQFILINENKSWGILNVTFFE